MPVNIGAPEISMGRRQRILSTEGLSLLAAAKICDVVDLLRGATQCDKAVLKTLTVTPRLRAVCVAYNDQHRANAALHPMAARTLSTI
ncbi:hypothetical protein ACM25N_12195 [Roseovarius sp. C7]|uniref:hypothetical protein n=1 Tax=Roseovarius sp. C7 TaxID=3398643 RepID=UPI0039F6B1AD